MIKYKCLSFNKDYSNKLDEKLKKVFKNKFKFSNTDINKFILLLRKSVYPDEYKDKWEKINETTLLEKEEIYGNLNMKDITDADYIHAKCVCKLFRMKNLSEYHDLHLKSDTLLLVDVFENFRKRCLKVYQLHPAKFLAAARLSWQDVLKRTKVKLELLTGIDIKTLESNMQCNSSICKS